MQVVLVRVMLVHYPPSEMAEMIPALASPRFVHGDVSPPEFRDYLVAYPYHFQHYFSIRSSHSNKERTCVRESARLKLSERFTMD